MNRKTEAFALAGFMLNVNLIRLLTFKGVISADEALATVEESRQQLSALGMVNQAARADMLDRELLDYEALFLEVDEGAAQALMATLAEALWRILDEDAGDAGAGDDATPGREPPIPETWERDGWGDDATQETDAPRQSPDETGLVMEIAEYPDDEEEPANQP